MPRTDEFPSRDLTFEWALPAPEQLAKAADTLDTKIIAVFSIASIIISVTTALSNKIQWQWSLIPFIVALLAYIFILIKSIIAINPQTFYVADSPKILREDYWKLPPEDAKNQYWEHLEQAYLKNREIVKSKGRTLKFTLIVLSIETLSLLVWLLL